MTAARKLTNAETYLESGTVEAVGETIEVKLWRGSCRARRAKSCLVSPDVGDRVLCAVEPEGAFVLAVLTGREGAKTLIEAEGDLELSAPAGKVAVRAADAVDLVSGGAVTATAAEINLCASRGSVAIEEMGFFGRVVQAEVARIALVAHEVDSVITRIAQKAKQVFRVTEDIDQTRAGMIDMRAQNLIALRGENAIVSARVLAKIDGEQIHLG
jgi:Protein of unknown function (DUF3540)